MDHVAPPPLRTRIARLLAMAVGAAALTATLAATSAPAQTAPDPVAAADAAADAKVADLRAQADALADHYFETLGRVAEIQQKADEIEAKLPALRAETERLRDLTRLRAVEAFKRSGHNLGAIVGARDPLAAARRARWLQRLNERDDAAVANLQDASAKLDTQRAALRAARDDAERTLADVKSQGDQINTLLANAEQQQAALTAATPTPAAADQSATATSPVRTPSGSDAPTTPTTSPSTTTTTAPPKSTPPPAPPTYTPTPGVHPHHDEPFLVCTRARESGGNYAAYNPAGPYMGAYQFLQATWNSAANHAGRPELVGVPPSTASQYDQDDLAWALYQWQGSRPWGGMCEDAT